jgi:YVTN family beta-propeller protein
MSLLARPRWRNLPFRNASQQQRDQFLSLRSIPILIFIASGLTIQPAPAASNPILDVIPLAAPALPAIEGIAASPNGDNVYVAVFENSSIAVINTATNLVTSIIPTTAAPLSVAVSPDGGTLYVTDQGASLKVFALPTGDPLFTLSLGGGGGIPAVSPNGKMLYVPVDNGTVIALDYVGNTATITTGGSPTQVVFNSAHALCHEQFR